MLIFCKKNSGISKIKSALVLTVKLDIRDSPQSSYIGQNSDGGIFNIWISGQSFILENCHNSRTSHDIDMKLRPVTKLDKRNTDTSKKIEDDVMLTNCHVITFTPINVQFPSIRKPDSLRMVYKTSIFINNNLLF